MPSRHPLHGAIAAALLLGTAACAHDPQRIKEGLWEIHSVSVENPGAKKAEFQYQLCRDHAYDSAANARVKNVKGCSTQFKDMGDGRYASASTCKVAGTSIVSNGITTYQKGESTHSETQARYSPPFNGKSTETMTEDQRYIGPCPLGVKIGDTIGPDGIVRHHAR